MIAIRLTLGSRHLAADSSFFNLRDSCFFQLFFWRACSSNYALLVLVCMSCFWGLRFWVSYACLALINGYYECCFLVRVKLFCFGSLCQVFFKIFLVCAARDTHFSAFITAERFDWPVYHFCCRRNRLIY